MGPTGRLVAAGLILLPGVVAVGLLTGAPAAAQDDRVERVTITGEDLPDPLVVEAVDDPQLCLALYHEISWLTGATGDAEAPEIALGPAYTIEVVIEGEPRHRYVLYPLAEGGPRVYRPAEQPGERTASEGWFVGRLGMPETLLAAGVNLPGVRSRLGGGGGGEHSSRVDDPMARTPVDTWLEGMLLATGVALSITAGLGAVAYLLRRKV
ncbi:MAG: hypothetical protein FWJ70_06760 [Micromonosporaceae bacterium]|jgi:hypothetical protein